MHPICRDGFEVPVVDAGERVEYKNNAKLARKMALYQKMHPPPARIKLALTCCQVALM
jgi:hypothetical protein